MEEYEKMLSENLKNGDIFMVRESETGMLNASR